MLSEPYRYQLTRPPFSVRNAINPNFTGPSNLPSSSAFCPSKSIYQTTDQ